MIARGMATDDRAAFVVQYGNYLRARWPGDAYLFRRRIALSASELDVIGLCRFRRSQPFALNSQLYCDAEGRPHL
jgi:hypothetical protein